MSGKDGVDSESTAALERAAEAGIHRLTIPTPFQVGRVNVYLIEDSPLTLLDCGPRSGEAMKELTDAIAALGHHIDDVGLIVITHQHLDHFGLAHVLAQRSGADVAALDILAPYLETFDEQSDRNDAFALATMARHGVAREVAVTLRSVSASFKGWGSSVHVARPLSVGDDLRLEGRSYEVLHRPGHSPSDTIFHDRERKMLLTGDHLIKHISSNPLISRPLEPPSERSPAQAPPPGPPVARTDPSVAGADRPAAGTEPELARPRALITYIDSLKKTREMDLEILLPGHGEPIVDHRALIDDRLRMHGRRAEKIMGLIAAEARSAHQIARELWGDVAVTQAYLTLSEVIGHVDILIEAGQVAESERDGVVIFEAT